MPGDNSRRLVKLYATFTPRALCLFTKERIGLSIIMFHQRLSAKLSPYNTLSSRLPDTHSPHPAHINYEAVSRVITFSMLFSSCIGSVLDVCEGMLPGPCVIVASAGQVQRAASNSHITNFFTNDYTFDGFERLRNLCDIFFNICRSLASYTMSCDGLCRVGIARIDISL